MGKRTKKKSRSIFRRITKSRFTTFVVIVGVMTIVVIDYLQRSKRDSIQNIVKERTLGSSDAALQIVEFLDFQCPQCKRGSYLIKQYLNTYPSEIFLGVKFFPLQQLHSLDSAIYAECASRQDKFWPFHDLLFERQDQWKRLKDAESYFQTIAQEVDLDVEELNACVKTDSARSMVLADKAYGEARKVSMTPTYILNGEMVVGFESFQRKLVSYFDNLPREEEE